MKPPSFPDSACPFAIYDAENHAPEICDFCILFELDDWINQYLEKHPRNDGQYSRQGYPTSIPKRLRDGVIFWSTGWGWRLRKDWKKTLDDRITRHHRH